jgi:hypothetical protein
MAAATPPELVEPKLTSPPLAAIEPLIVSEPLLKLTVLAVITAPESRVTVAACALDVPPKDTTPPPAVVAPMEPLSLSVPEVNVTESDLMAAPEPTVSAIPPLPDPMLTLVALKLEVKVREPLPIFTPSSTLMSELIFKLLATVVLRLS